MAEFITIMVYCVLGTALMLFGTFVVDLVIPCEFPAEIKKGNVAVGSVMAGISVGIGIIIRAAVMSPSGTAVHESLLTGIASTIYYYVVGLVFCVLGYLALNLINRKYDLNKEITQDYGLFGKSNLDSGSCHGSLQYCFCLHYSFFHRQGR